MNLKLDELILENFGIFKGKHVLDFRNKDVVGIVAEYDGDKKRSNRSGKTLVIESIKYLLVGITRAKKESDMIHYGEKAMLVTGIFSDDDGNQYTVIRGRDNKNNGALRLDWVEKGRESQAAIEDLFGVTRDDFELTNFFKQSDINGFMDKSPAEKTTYLMKWLDNEHWKDKEARAKKDRDRLKNELRDCESALKAIDNAIDIDDDVEVLIQSLKDTNVELKEKGAKLSKKIRKIDEKVKEVKKHQATAKQDIQKLTESLEENEENIKSKKKYAERIRNGKQAIKELLSEMHTLDTDYKELLQKRAEIKQETKTIKKQLSSLKEAGGMCPLLNEKCDRIEPNTKDGTKRLMKLDKEYEGLKEEIDKHLDNEESEETIIKYKHVVEKLEIKLKSVKVIEDTSLIEKSIAEKQKILRAKFDKILDERERLEDDVLEIDSDMSGNEREIGKLEQRLLASENARKESAALSEKISELRLELSDANCIVQMFGKNGIPADEIDNAFVGLEDQINALLKEHDSGSSITFQADKEINKWEPVCGCGFVFPKGYRKKECEDCGASRRKQRVDEININVVEDGNESGFNMDSGGGKLIISYCVRVALSLLKKTQGKCKLNMLFLDEIDAPLDPHLAGQIMNSITRVLTKRLGYDQILLVSHKEEIKNSVPHILKVTRKGTASKVRFTE